MKSILFYWSRGAEVRRRLVLFVSRCNLEGKPCFLNLLAKHLGLTHAGVKKHLDLLLEEGYVEQINPAGKPIYLRLTTLGEGVAGELAGRDKGSASSLRKD